MDIREALAAEHSKRRTLEIVRYVGNDPARFKELIGIFLSNDYRAVQRASWAVSYCVEAHPQLVRPYFSKLLAVLERDDVHTAAHRNIFRMFQFVDIPPRYRGRLYDICTKFLDDLNQPVAIRAFALTVAANVAAGEQSLLNELKLIVEKSTPHSTIALCARARHVLGDLPPRPRVETWRTRDPQFSIVAKGVSKNGKT
jgi:hypothetical protein